jgi:signal transduction histidine kinase
MSQARAKRDVVQSPDLNDTKVERAGDPIRLIIDTIPVMAWSVRPDVDHLALEITDRGRGMSPDVLSSVTSGSGAPGVGLAGMRERLQQLGGALHFESNDRGTTLRATVPLPEHFIVASSRSPR